MITLKDNVAIARRYIAARILRDFGVSRIDELIVVVGPSSSPFSPKKRTKNTRKEGLATSRKGQEWRKRVQNTFTRGLCPRTRAHIASLDLPKHFLAFKNVAAFLRPISPESAKISARRFRDAPLPFFLSRRSKATRDRATARQRSLRARSSVVHTKHVPPL